MYLPVNLVRIVILNYSPKFLSLTQRRPGFLPLLQQGRRELEGTQYIIGFAILEVPDFTFSLSRFIFPTVMH